MCCRGLLKHNQDDRGGEPVNALRRSAAPRRLVSCEGRCDAVIHAVSPFACGPRYHVKNGPAGAQTLRPWPVPAGEFLGLATLAHRPRFICRDSSVQLDRHQASGCWLPWCNVLVALSVSYLSSVCCSSRRELGIPFRVSCRAGCSDTVRPLLSSSIASSTWPSLYLAIALTRYSCGFSLAQRAARGG